MHLPGRPLKLAEYRNAHAEQSGGGEHAQQRIGDDHIEDVPHHLCRRAGRRNNVGQAAGNTLLQSFLLPFRMMAAGPGVEPGDPDAKSGVLPMH